MRSIIYTKDKSPRVVFEISCDLELLSACIEDGEVTPDQIVDAVKRAMAKLNDAILLGQQRAKDA